MPKCANILGMCIDVKKLDLCYISTYKRLYIRIDKLL